MAKLVYRHKEYIVLEGRRGHTIINTKGNKDNHGHIKYLDTCEMLLNLMYKKVVPDSSYLRGTVLRISLDDKYKQKVNNRIAKDKSRQFYYNPQKGVRAWYVMIII